MYNQKITKIVKKIMLKTRLFKMNLRFYKGNFLLIQIIELLQFFYLY